MQKSIAVVSPRADRARSHANSALHPAKPGAWQLIFSGIGYAMINNNLAQMDRKLIDEVIESIVRGLKG